MRWWVELGSYLCTYVYGTWHLKKNTNAMAMVTPPCVPSATAGSNVGAAPGGSTSVGSCLMGRGWNPGGGRTCNQNTMVKNVCMYIIIQFQSQMRSTTKKVSTTMGGIWCWLLIQLRSSRSMAPAAQVSRCLSSLCWALSSATFSLHAWNTKRTY